MRAVCTGLLVLVVLAGCSKTPAAEPGSCYRPQDNICIEYSADQGAAGQRLCAGLKWTPGASSCATAARLGTCAKKDAKELYYAGPPNNYDPTSAKTACDHASGTWTPGAPKP